MSHTPGMLRASALGSLHCEDGEALQVAGDGYHGEYADEYKGNAHRIVAYWNACEALGVSTEMLEGGILAEIRDLLESGIGFCAGFAGQYQVSQNLKEIHPTHQKEIDRFRAVLSRLKGDK